MLRTNCHKSSCRSTPAHHKQVCIAKAQILPNVSKHYLCLPGPSTMSYLAEYARQYYRGVLECCFFVLSQLLCRWHVQYVTWLPQQTCISFICHLAILWKWLRRTSVCVCILWRDVMPISLQSIVRCCVCALVCYSSEWNMFGVFELISDPSHVCSDNMEWRNCVEEGGFLKVFLNPDIWFADTCRALLAMIVLQSEALGNVKKAVFEDLKNALWWATMFLLATHTRVEHTINVASNAVLILGRCVPLAWL